MIFMIENEPEIIRVKRNCQIDCTYRPDPNPLTTNKGLIQTQSIDMGKFSDFSIDRWKIDTRTTLYDCKIAFYDTILDTRKAEIRCDKDMLDNLIRLLQHAKFHMDMSQLEYKLRMKNEPN